MALDRFIQFPDTAPTRDEIGQVLHDYLGDLAVSIAWDRDRFLVTLRGSPRNMFTRQDPHARAYAHDGPERWFEVWLAGARMDVITRQQDHVTNVLAEGFARACAQFWGGAFE